MGYRKNAKGTFPRPLHTAFRQRSVYRLFAVVFQPGFIYRRVASHLLFFNHLCISHPQFLQIDILFPPFFLDIRNQPYQPVFEVIHP